MPDPEAPQPQVAEFPQLELSPDKVYQLLEPPTSDVPWDRVNKQDTKKVEKYEAYEEEMRQQHKLENAQMRAQLAEDPMAADTLRQQIGYQIEEVKQQIRSLEEQVFYGENPGEE